MAEMALSGWICSEFPYELAFCTMVISGNSTRSVQPKSIHVKHGQHDMSSRKEKSLYEHFRIGIGLYLSRHPNGMKA